MLSYETQAKSSSSLAWTPHIWASASARCRFFTHPWTNSCLLLNLYGAHAIHQTSLACGKEALLDGIWLRFTWWLNYSNCFNDLNLHFPFTNTDLGTHSLCSYTWSTQRLKIVLALQDKNPTRVVRDRVMRSLPKVQSTLLLSSNNSIISISEIRIDL